MSERQIVGDPYIKLLPCPFCGGEGGLFEITTQTDIVGADLQIRPMLSHYVRCMRCEMARTVVSTMLSTAVCEWNRRTPLPAEMQFRQLLRRKIAQRILLTSLNREAVPVSFASDCWRLANAFLQAESLGSIDDKCECENPVRWMSLGLVFCANCNKPLRDMGPEIKP